MTTAVTAPAAIDSTPETAFAWREPVEVAAALADRPWVVALLSDGGPNGRWSYVAAEPDRIEELAPADPRDGLDLLREMLGPRRPHADGAPFQGGVVGLAAYEFAARLEALDMPREPGWPDLTLARYPTVLAFDHEQRRVMAYGDLELAAGWLEAPPRPRPRETLASVFEADAPSAAYEAAVADVVARIEAGEIFQANIARSWSGRLKLGVHPFDLVRRLAAVSRTPFAAAWRMHDRALVSNSPERFVAIEPEGNGGFTVETRPIKGTRPRGAGRDEDERLVAELLASEKDRAENLMIVDLMRNDLARVCEPGSVITPELFRVESFANVHHLVSTVTGRLAPGSDAADLLRAAFPPGSITGAPKVQAMKTIALHEGARGPWCGSLFWAGFDGAFDSSVLIRSAALSEDERGWRFRAQAGAGIVADSDPVAECEETEAKIAALKRALTTPVPNQGLSDRGLTLGDGLFETLLWRDGDLEDAGAHYQRLARGCAVLGLAEPGVMWVKGAAWQAVHDHGFSDVRAAVRVSWTAGEGGRGLDRVEGTRPKLMVTVGPAPEPGGETTLATVSVRRNEGSPTSRMKSLSYLDNVLARREAAAAGAGEALMLNNRGEVACAAAANIFWFEGDRLCTPALDCGVLDGIVRGHVLAAAAELGIEVAEVASPLAALATATGLFLTNSLIGLRRVSTLDGRAVAPNRLFDLLAASRPW